MSKKLIDRQLGLLSGIDFGEFAREMARVAQPALGLMQRQMQLGDPFKGLAEDLRRQSEVLSRALDFGEPFRAFLDSIAAEERKFGPVEAAGWLPHHTTPFDQIEQDSGPVLVGMKLSEHYRMQWPVVRAQFLSKLANCEVDEEAKATFVEVLDAHENGLHRCAPRVLFPEIERVVRAEFFPDDFKERLASQPWLIQTVGSLPGVEVTRQFVAGLRLFKIFSRHLYQKVDTKELVASVRADPVPNRHATTHGLAIYKTQQTSLNAIIIAEYAFMLISMIKRYSAESAASEVA